MPRVRMLTSMATKRHSWARGEIVEATPDEAQSWLAAGIAELVRGRPPLTPESRKQKFETRKR